MRMIFAAPHLDESAESDSFNKIQRQWWPGRAAAHCESIYLYAVTFKAPDNSTQCLLCAAPSQLGISRLPLGEREGETGRKEKKKEKNVKNYLGHLGRNLL